MGDDKPMRLLVACHNIVLAGGLLRFDRIARTIAAQGHEMAFLAFDTGDVYDRPTILPVLSFDQASQQRWDAVMVPGAGFPRDTIQRFADLKAPTFGRRIQHCLNDQTRREGFLTVNRAFEPHAVVFNNLHWPPGSYDDFHAEVFHTLPGAIDTDRFKPDPVHRRPVHSGRWVVGGLSNKNVGPLIEATKHLPDVELRLFGTRDDAIRSAHPDLVASGKITLVGRISDDHLPAYYRSIDCVAMTEHFAGWANLAAEALACGVPLICTPHGTTAFARHEDTALVVDEPTPGALQESIVRLQNNPDQCRKLAMRGRAAIEPYDWRPYCDSLLRMVSA